MSDCLEYELIYNSYGSASAWNQNIKTSSNTRSEICTSERKVHEHECSKVFLLISTNLHVAIFQGHQNVCETEKLLVLTDGDANANAFC